MARAVAGRITIAVDLMETADGLGVGDGIAQYRHALSQVVDVATGTSDGQMDRAYSTAGTASSTPTDIDLTGSLSSALGSANFVDVSLIMIKNTGSTTTLRIGGDANFLALFGAAADFLLLPAGGCICWYAPAGIGVTATTGDILQLDTASGTTTYQAVIGGRSA